MCKCKKNSFTNKYFKLNETTTTTTTTPTTTTKTINII